MDQPKLINTDVKSAGKRVGLMLLVSVGLAVLVVIGWALTHSEGGDRGLEDMPLGELEDE